MATSEEIEMARYRHEIVLDLQHMLAKYCRIMEWDVPDVQDVQARALVLETMRSALDEVEAQAS